MWRGVLPTALSATLMCLLLCVGARESVAVPLFDTNQRVTCQGRCGMEVPNPYPCACVAKCLIQGNCCEDFDLHCPEIELSDEMSAILTSGIACDSSNVWMVMSCPKAAAVSGMTSTIPSDPSNRTFRTDNLDDSVLSSSLRSLKNVSDRGPKNPLRDDGNPGMTTKQTVQYGGRLALSTTDITTAPQTFQPDTTETTVDSDINIFLKTINDAPVTHPGSGLTFANLQVLTCNGLNDGTGISWRTSHRMDSSRQPSNMLSLGKIISKDNFIYEPPASAYTYLRGSVCSKGDIISSCQNSGRYMEHLDTASSFFSTRASTTTKSMVADQQDHSRTGLPQEYNTSLSGPSTYEESERRCGEFISYVLEAKYLSTFFSNRFCFLCSSGYGSDFIPGTGNIHNDREFQFSATFDVSKSVIEIEAVLKAGMARFVKRPWKKVQCERSGENDEKIGDGLQSGLALPLGEGHELGRCSVLACGDGYELRADGYCRKSSDLAIAVSDGHVPFTAHELALLPSYLTCVAKAALKMEVTEGQRRTQLRKRVMLEKLDAAQDILYFVNLTGYVLMPGISIFEYQSGLYSLIADMAVQFHALNVFRSNLQRKISEGDFINEQSLRPAFEPLLTFNLHFMYPNLDDEFDEVRGRLLNDSSSESVTEIITGQNRDLILCVAGPPEHVLGCYKDATREGDIAKIRELLQPGYKSCLDIYRNKSSYSGHRWVAKTVLLLTTIVLARPIELDAM